MVDNFGQSLVVSQVEQAFHCIRVAMYPGCDIFRLQYISVAIPSDRVAWQNRQS